MPQPKNKIALVGNTLSKGGAERVQARLSFFFEANDIEVHHILVTNEISYPYAGKLFNMGLLKNNNNGVVNKWKRLQALKNYLATHSFDYIIDFRVKRSFFQEYLIANWVYKAPYIMSIRSFNTEYYFPNDIKKAKSIYKSAYGITTVSNALEQKIRKYYGYTQVETIYNPLDVREIEKLSGVPLELDFKFILGIGRMQSNIKQFDHLIKAYNDSEARQAGIDLVILGEGPDKSVYEALVNELGMNAHVHFHDFTANPHPYYKAAFATALTSKFEGFPNVLIESLANQTPVISYDCESGPNEIIKHEHNGLLVEDQSIEAMKEAINRMVKDEALYHRCKTNAKNSIASFSMETIGQHWLDFLKLRNN